RGRAGRGGRPPAWRLGAGADRPALGAPGGAALEHALHVLGEAASKGGDREALGVLYGARRLEAELVEPFDRAAEGVDVVEPRERAGLAVDHGLQRAAGGGRDHRSPGGLRLDGGDAE